MVSGLKNDSRVKKKQKMVFAKDKKQAVMAIVVMVIFFGNGLRMIVLYIQEQIRMNAPVTQVAEDKEKMTPQIMAEKKAMMDGKNSPEGAQGPTDMAEDANDIYEQTMNLQKDSPQQQRPVSIDSEAGVKADAKANS